MSVMVFIVYTCALALQFLIRGKNYRIKDLLQLPMSLFFSVFLDLYERAFNAIFTVAFDKLWQNLLLLAVAILYPMMQVNLNGLLPLRMKWLALIDVVLLLPGLVNGSWGERIAIIVSLLNVALFFCDKFIYHIKEAKRRYEWKKSWRTGKWR